MLKTSLNRGIRVSLMIVMLGVISALHTNSNAQEAPPIFGDVAISQKFSPDPLVVRGMSGGSVAADQVAGRIETPTGPCNGFVDKTPDHTIRLNNNFAYLKLQVQSPQDTTIVVKGPGGTWCNDDVKGKNPGISGEWLAGAYQVWVGSYKKDQYFPYKLEITEVR